MKRRHRTLFHSADTATGGAPAPAAPAPEPSTPVAPAVPDPTDPSDPTDLPAAPATPAPAAPAAPVPPAAPATPAESARKNIFARAGDFLKDRAALTARISELEAAATSAGGQISARDIQIGALTAELQELRAGRDQLAATVASLESSATNVSAGIVDTLAQMGVPAAALPAADAEAASAEDIAKSFAAITDPEKRARFYAENKGKLLRSR